MAMPAWLATEASRRLSLVEYGSSESRGPSTATPCNWPSLEPRIGTRHSGCSGSNWRSMHGFRQQFQRIAAVGQFGNPSCARRERLRFRRRITGVRLQSVRCSASRYTYIELRMQRILNLIVQQRRQSFAAADGQVSSRPGSPESAARRKSCGRRRGPAGFAPADAPESRPRSAARRRSRPPGSPPSSRRRRWRENACASQKVAPTETARMRITNPRSTTK